MQAIVATSEPHLSVVGPKESGSCWAAVSVNLDQLAQYSSEVHCENSLDYDLDCELGCGYSSLNDREACRF